MQTLKTQLPKPSCKPGTMSGRVLEFLSSGPKSYTELYNLEMKLAEQRGTQEINPYHSFIIGRMLAHKQITRIKRGTYSLI